MSDFLLFIIAALTLYTVYDHENNEGTIYARIDISLTGSDEVRDAARCSVNFRLCLY